MATRQGYEVVHVTLDGGTVKCDPDPAHCYWDTGPADVRWVFSGVPGHVRRAVIEWKEKAPFRGHGHAPSSGGSHLADLVTTGNTKEKGHFLYSVLLFDESGAQVGSVDPELHNDPGPP